eukprot:CAMPEP_0201124488 /NCGR_PEP_ID=MMETSP0850-20130426/14002_1 /ASSEMBLY_ACC=CAM_ASM_000622 /TAXON_ID=183588 /ORGANISM="Pseudo-nitzschia fraudulenta, Strain WWA7" /LENGTH=265 /DNA_ID=CAMNT_0047391901 /DNA_START=297 /DNA_END=1094 /DNA_ORIENTATION=-
MMRSLVHHRSNAVQNSGGSSASCASFSSLAMPEQQLLLEHSLTLHDYNKSKPKPTANSQSPTPRSFREKETEVADQFAMIRSTKDFVDRVPDAVSRRKLENIEPGAPDDPVARLFRQSNFPSDAWQKYALFDDKKPYTRNLISTDNETYTLLVLCWNPQQESPIHDHPCDGCWLQVLRGGIREVRYDKQLHCVSEMDYHQGELSYITDNVGYHKVGNPTQEPAVTLHLYAPPFDRCQCWDSERADPSEPSEGRNINHSEYGVLKS